MVKIFRQCPYMYITCQIDVEGIHDEAVQKNYFFNFYKWIVGKKPARLLEAESHFKIDQAFYKSSAPLWF